VLSHGNMGVINVSVMTYCIVSTWSAAGVSDWWMRYLLIYRLSCSIFLFGIRFRLRRLVNLIVNNVPHQDEIVRRSLVLGF